MEKEFVYRCHVDVDENVIAIIPPVQSVFIEDFEIIEKADIKFSKGLNLIVGKSASGKTAVLKYLVQNSTPPLMSAGEKVMFDINNIITENCILIDDLLCRLDKENLIKILKTFETCNRQVIAVIQVCQLDSIKGKIKANIIDTKDFKLKNLEKK